MKPKTFYRRVFLNPKKGVAALEAKYTKHDGNFNCEGNLKITACNHVVNLEFGWYDNNGKIESEKKLATLIKELTSLQQFLFPEEVGHA